MNNRPLISVIITTHNRAELLKRSVSSVLNQTFSELELIIVDDFSTDETVSVVKKYVDDRIRYYRHEQNLGGSAARNTGISVSRGAFIAFLDDDDEWLPDKLKAQKELFDINPELGMVYTGCFYVRNRDGKVLKTVRPVKDGHIYKDLLNQNCIGTTSTAMVKRECFNQVGGFDEDLGSCQDWDMWIRLSKKYKIGVISSPSVRFYIHNNRITSNQKVKIESIEKVFKKNYSQIASNPKILSNQYFKIGRMHLINGEFSDGRRKIFEAMKIFPFRYGYYKYYLFSFLGPRIYNKLVKFKLLMRDSSI